MEAKDAPGKIRPLPPAQPEGTSPPTQDQPDRRWVPIAVAGGALVFFGLLAGLLSRAPTTSNAGTDDASAPTTTASGLGAPQPPRATTTTTPPTLRDRVPILEGRIRIVSADIEGTVTMHHVWSLDETEPNPASVSGGAARSAAFDASHQELAWITTGRRNTLWVGLPPSAEPVFVDVEKAAWHPTRPLTLAWLGRTIGDSQLHLFQGLVLPGIGLDEVIDLGTVPAGSTLAGWGDWGFALEVAPPPTQRQWRVVDASTGITSSQLLGFTVLLDPSGMQTSSLAGSPRSTSQNGYLVIQTAPEAYALARDAGLDIATMGIEHDPIVIERDALGRPFVVVGPDLEPTGVGFAPSSSATTFLFTPDGAYVTAAGSVDGRLAMTTEAVDGTQRRITSVGGVDVAVGFSRDGRIIVLNGLAGGDLVFHDWNRGATFAVPWPFGPVVAVDL